MKPWRMAQHCNRSLMLFCLVATLHTSKGRERSYFSPQSTPSASFLRQLNVLRGGSSSPQQPGNAFSKSGGRQAHEVKTGNDSKRRQNPISRWRQSLASSGGEMFRTWIMLRELGATFAEMDGVRMRVVVLFVLTVASGATTIAFSFIGAEFWEALSRKDRVGFHALLKKFALALVLVMALYDYAKDSAALAWREHLTGKVLFGYM
ncbi:unnamed protein product, partial [Phaeothamnion confervicola]